MLVEYLFSDSTLCDGASISCIPMPQLKETNKKLNKLQFLSIKHSFTMECIFDTMGGLGLTKFKSIRLFFCGLFEEHFVIHCCATGNL